MAILVENMIMNHWEFGGLHKTIIQTDFSYGYSNPWFFLCCPSVPTHGWAEIALVELVGACFKMCYHIYIYIRICHHSSYVCVCICIYIQHICQDLGQFQPLMWWVLLKSFLDSSEVGQLREELEKLNIIPEAMELNQVPWPMLHKFLMLHI